MAAPRTITRTSRWNAHSARAALPSPVRRPRLVRPVVEAFAFEGYEVVEVRGDDRVDTPTDLERLEGGYGARRTDQSSGRSAKWRLAARYQPIPEMGCFHLPFISFRALACVSSPSATISLR